MMLKVPDVCNLSLSHSLALHILFLFCDRIISLLSIDLAVLSTFSRWTPLAPFLSSLGKVNSTVYAFVSSQSIFKSNLLCDIIAAYIYSQVSWCSVLVLSVWIVIENSESSLNYLTVGDQVFEIFLLVDPTFLTYPVITGIKMKPSIMIMSIKGIK